jgi:hypothetical protein
MHTAWVGEDAMGFFVRATKRRVEEGVWRPGAGGRCNIGTKRWSVGPTSWSHRTRTQNKDYDKLYTHTHTYTPPLSLSDQAFASNLGASAGGGGGGGGGGAPPASGGAAEPPSPPPPPPPPPPPAAAAAGAAAAPPPPAPAAAVAAAAAPAPPPPATACVGFTIVGSSTGSQLGCAPPASVGVARPPVGTHRSASMRLAGLTPGAGPQARAHVRTGSAGPAAPPSAVPRGPPRSRAARVVIWLAFFCFCAAACAKTRSLLFSVQRRSGERERLSCEQAST